MFPCSTGLDPSGPRGSGLTPDYIHILKDQRQDKRNGLCIAGWKAGISFRILWMTLVKNQKALSSEEKTKTSNWVFAWNGIVCVHNQWKMNPSNDISHKDQLWLQFFCHTEKQKWIKQLLKCCFAGLIESLLLLKIKNTVPLSSFL